MPTTTLTQKNAPKLANIQQYQNHYLAAVEKSLGDHNLTLDDYQKTCILNAVSAMYEVKDVDFSKVPTSTVAAILQRVSMLRLNAYAQPRQVYFVKRNIKTASGGWENTIEMGVEGDGNDAELAYYGAGVKKVHPYWVVREGDDFTPPHYKGMEVTPPEWTPCGTGRPIAVVYPIQYEDDHVEYHIGYRGDVRTNLVAHIANNLMNETFGIAQSRYKATDAQKQEIDAKKKAILDALVGKTVDEILTSPDFKPYISPAWNLDQSGDQMLIRKMRNNIVKKLPKDYSKYLCDLSGYKSANYNDPDDIPAEPELPAPAIDIPSTDVTVTDPATEPTTPADPF